MIQGLLILNDPTYIPENWHGTLLVIALTAFCIIFNTFLAKKLPMVEGMVLIVHLLGFFAVLVPLWVLAPRSSPKDVFTGFSNFGGWSSTGLAFMVGLLAPVYTLELILPFTCPKKSKTRQLSFLEPLFGQLQSMVLSVLSWLSHSASRLEALKMFLPRQQGTLSSKSFSTLLRATLAHLS